MMKSSKFFIILLFISILANVQVFASSKDESQSIDNTSTVNIKCNEVPLSPGPEVSPIALEINEIAQMSCMNEEQLNERCECLSDTNFELDEEEQRDFAKKLHKQYLGDALLKRLTKLNEKHYYFKKLYMMNELELPKCDIDSDVVEKVLLVEPFSFSLEDYNIDRKNITDKYGMTEEVYWNTKSIRKNINLLKLNKKLFSSYYRTDLKSESLVAFVSRIMTSSQEDGHLDSHLIQENYNKFINEYIHSYTSIREVDEERLRDDTFELVNIFVRVLLHEDIIDTKENLSYLEVKDLVQTTMNSFLLSMFDNYKESCEEIKEDIDMIARFIDAPVFEIDDLELSAIANSLSTVNKDNSLVNKPNISYLFCKSIKGHIPEVFADYNNAFKKLISHRANLSINYDGKLLSFEIGSKSLLDKFKEDRSFDLALSPEANPDLSPEELERKRELWIRERMRRLRDEQSLLVMENIEQRVAREYQSEKLISNGEFKKISFVDIVSPYNQTSAVYSSESAYADADTVKLHTVSKTPMDHLKTSPVKLDDVKKRILDEVNSIVNSVDTKSKVLTIKNIDRNSDDRPIQKKNSEEKTETISKILDNVEENKFRTGYNGRMNLYNYFTNPGVTSLASFYKFEYKDPNSIPTNGLKIAARPKGLSRIYTRAKSKKINSRNRRIPDSIKKYNETNNLDTAAISGRNSRNKKAKKSLFDGFRPRVLPDNSIVQDITKNTDPVDISNDKNTIAKGQSPLETFKSTVSESDNDENEVSSSSTVLPTGVLKTSSLPMKSSNKEDINSTVKDVTSSNRVNEMPKRTFLFENEFKQIEDSKLRGYMTSDNYVYVFIKRTVHNIEIHYLQTFKIVFDGSEVMKELLSTESLYRVEMTNSKLKVVNEFFDLKRKGEIL